MLIPQKIVFVLATALISIVGIAYPRAVQAQVPTQRVPIVGRHPGSAPRQEPCWREAGVTKAAIEQRRAIEQNARAEIQSLCANSSLTPQQRREQIRAIRERSREQVDALISPQQREAIKSCQQARNGGHPGGGGFHGGGGHGEGPCGEMNEPKETAEPKP